jgi:hypothetical protein
MKPFDSQFIDRLNALYGGGVLLRAALVFLPSRTDAWVSYNESVVYRGITYQPLPMIWDGVEASSGMQLPGVRVSVDNTLGLAEDYIDSVNLLGCDVLLQLFSLELLQYPSYLYADEIALQVQSIEVTMQAVSVMCGINLGLSDALPKHILTLKEFPGIPDQTRRLTII